MNVYLVFIIALLIFSYLLEVLVEVLNIRHIRTTIPEEFEGWFDEGKYAKSQRYLKDSTWFDILSSSIMLPLSLAFILLGGFRVFDDLARSAGGGMIVTGLLFAGLLMILAQGVSIPFSIYSTFVIEERYGFNKTTPKTFVLDIVKGLLLSIVIGAPVFAGVLWFFAHAGSGAWFYSWVAVAVIQLFLLYISPVVILPLFNKFTPLEEGELRDGIVAYADQEQFRLKGIFKIDGSRRSSKSNAYFTGLGRWKRIALFDTLIEKHSISELIAVLAHEVGHYRHGHIRKQILISLASSALMFYILSIFITRPGLYQAFGLEMTPIGGAPPIYAGMVFFGFLYAPISMVLGIITSFLSRKYEYEADAFAARTIPQREDMITALKKLSVDNLSNLSPHPLKVFLDYSHPPVLERIRAIRAETD
ncbi:MAG: M48 family peptidase [Spartobacteria bacterium]|nr:M48 family peptidase [Spartobacteria bacterium]